MRNFTLTTGGGGSCIVSSLLTSGWAEITTRGSCGEGGAITGQPNWSWLAAGAQGLAPAQAIIAKADRLSDNRELLMAAMLNKTIDRTLAPTVTCGLPGTTHFPWLGRCCLPSFPKIPQASIKSSRYSR